MYFFPLQEWKVINPYHVQVRKKLKKEESEEIEANDAKGGEGENQDEENQRKTSEQQHYVKMSLQLYQVSRPVHCRISKRCA